MALTKKQKEKNLVRHKMIKKLIGLALLPSETIASGYELINKERLEKFPSDINLHNFFEYFEKQWLPQNDAFCVYRQKKRTNNVLETNNRWIAQELGSKAQPEVF